MRGFRSQTLCCVVFAIAPVVFAMPFVQSTRTTVEENLNVLRSSRDRNSLERAAVALANMADPAAVLQLGEFLRRSEFLARLDNVRSSDAKTLHLREVMAALAAHPIAAVGELCLTLSKDKNFLDDEDRMDSLLETLAAVKPMTEEAAEFFSRTNVDGYFAFNAPLLVKNGSPRALELFESMVRDRSVDVNRRIDSIHRVVLPYRTSLPVVNSAERLLSADLEDSVAAGLVETIFDYKPKQWFGPAVRSPRPPEWQSASPEALQTVVRLGEKVSGRRFVGPDLAGVIQRTILEVQKVLAIKAR
ncbi:MAG: hypothetical protein DMG14_30300 [Acidobacteria bacterium]|nr:MAG: hypothetical protein DMG14_30300 [Acidobacteriota bacterium]